MTGREHGQEPEEQICIDDYPEHDFEAQDERDGITTLVCRRCGAESWESSSPDREGAE